MSLAAQSAQITREVPSSNADSSVEVATEPRQRDWKTMLPLSIAFLSVFVDLLGVTLILPIIPFLAIELDASSLQVGIVFAAYAGAQMISTPICGWLSDKIGRRPTLLMSLAGSAVGFLLQGLATSVVFLIAARAAAGLFGGSIPICQSFIADVFPEEQRPRYFAMLGAVITVAFMLGPGIGAGLSKFSLQTPMFVASGLATFGLFVALRYFHTPPRKPPSTSTSTASTEEASAAPSPLEIDAVALQRSHQSLIIIMYATSFAVMFSISSQLYICGLYFERLFSWGALETGFASMGMAIVAIAAQVLIFGRLIKKLGRHTTGAIGALVLCLGYVAFALLGTEPTTFRGVPLLCISYSLIGVGQVCASTCITSLLSRYASSTRQGLVLGISQSLQGLARTVGPLSWTSLFENVSPAAPFWGAAIAAGVTSLGFLLALHLNRQLPEHQQRAISSNKLNSAKDKTDGAIQIHSPLAKTIDFNETLDVEGVSLLRAEVKSLHAQNAQLQKQLNNVRSFQGDDEMGEVFEANAAQLRG